MNEQSLNNELRKISKQYIKLSNVIEYLINNEEINALLSKANDNMIGRMSYTDHGRIHAKITALNSLKIMSLLNIKPTIIKERDGNIEDSLITIVIASWLHDTGCAVNRDDHELTGVIITQPIIKRILKGVYEDTSKITKLSTFINEAILCHMTTHHSTSIEAGIVCIADGLDITKGRARFSYTHGDRDIHDFSAMSIQRVELKKSRKIEIHVHMNTPAGIFQVERVLLKKLESTILRNHFKIIVHIKGDKELITY